MFTQPAKSRAPVGELAQQAVGQQTGGSSGANQSAATAMPGDEKLSGLRSPPDKENEVGEDFAADNRLEQSGSHKADGRWKKRRSRLPPAADTSSLVELYRRFEEALSTRERSPGFHNDTEEDCLLPGLHSNHTEVNHGDAVEKSRFPGATSNAAAETDALTDERPDCRGKRDVSDTQLATTRTESSVIEESCAFFRQKQNS